MASSVGMFSVSSTPLAWRSSVARFDPKAAASARARLAVAVTLGQPAVFHAAELAALAQSIAMSATALRHARPSPSLPVYAFDPAAARAAAVEGAIVNPAGGKSAIVLDPCGAIMGRADEASHRAQLAAANALHIIASCTPTTAPTIDLDPSIVVGPPIETVPGGGEKLGAAPLIVGGIIVGGILLLGGGIAIGNYFSGKRAEMDAKKAIEVNDADKAAALTVERMKLEASTGKTIAPSPLELAAAERIKGGASKESGRGWMFFGIGAILGAGAIIGAPHASRRLGMGAR
jgi:hypothetical protein